VKFALAKARALASLGLIEKEIRMAIAR
jgi:predicted transglutaminase-like cysteine proteinase